MLAATELPNNPDGTGNDTDTEETVMGEGAGVEEDDNNNADNGGDDGHPPV